MNPREYLRALNRSHSDTQYLGHARYDNKLRKFNFPAFFKSLFCLISGDQNEAQFELNFGWNECG